MIKLNCAANLFTPLSLLAIISCPSLAQASAFQLFEQSAALTGQAYVASAAMANDATAEFYNPAGLVRLQAPQFVWGTVYAAMDMEYKGSSTFVGVPPFIPGLATEFGKTEASKEILIPSLYYAQPLNDAWAFAFGVWSPFGLATDYSANSLVRYSATRTALTVIDLSPALAYQLTPQWSVGAALDVEYAKVHFDSRFPTTVLGAPEGSPDAKITNNGDDWRVGWHGGLLYQYSPATRVGLSYHSKMKHHFKGDSEFSSVIPGIGVIRSNDLSANLTLPSYASLGVTHDVNARVAAMASVDYTHWSTIGTVTLKNVAFPGGPISQDFVQKYHDTWRYGVAGHVKVTPTWLMRAGLVYDQTPTRQSYRHIRLADGDRVVLALGTHWQCSEEVGIDIGYMHFFMEDGKLANMSEAGKSNNHADALSFQLTWDMI